MDSILIRRVRGIINPLYHFSSGYLEECFASSLRYSERSTMILPGNSKPFPLLNPAINLSPGGDFSWPGRVLK